MCLYVAKLTIIFSLCVTICTFVKGLTFAKMPRKRGLLRTSDRFCLVSELSLHHTRWVFTRTCKSLLGVLYILDSICSMCCLDTQLLLCLFTVQLQRKCEMPGGVQERLQERRTGRCNQTRFSEDGNAAELPAPLVSEYILCCTC